jgi:hypothetical protein
MDGSRCISLGLTPGMASVPELMIRMLIIGYVFAIRSERAKGFAVECLRVVTTRRVPVIRPLRWSKLDCCLLKDK